RRNMLAWCECTSECARGIAAPLRAPSLSSPSLLMEPPVNHKRKRDDDDDGDRLPRRQREFPPAHALVIAGSALSLSFPGRLRPVTRDDLDSALSDLSDVKFDDLRILDLSPTFICPPLTKPRFATLN